MKCALLFSLLFSVQAFAFPAVGDRVEHAGKYFENGTTKDFDLVLEVTEFNSNTNEFKVVQTTIENNGQPKIVEQWLPPQGLWSEDELKQMLADCEAKGNKESVTVKAGTFDVCRLDESTYFGKVPFGMVKVDGPDIQLELQSYKIGR